MITIGHIRTDFNEKFGIPRQGGIVPELKGRVIFEPEFRNPDAFKGLDGYSHIWILWEFESNEPYKWTATVKPPRLDGRKMGVFATRSPYRPNHIGMTSVKLEKIEYSEEYGPVLHVSGIDMRDNTPVYDIKPYLVYADSHPDASKGFTGTHQFHTLNVDFPEELLKKLPEDRREAILGVLKQDMRPFGKNEEGRIYGIAFAGFNIKFTVSTDDLKVIEVSKIKKENQQS